MKRKVSEFAYGFVLTHELVGTHGWLRVSESENLVRRGARPAKRANAEPLQFSHRPAPPNPEEEPTGFRTQAASGRRSFVA